MKKEDAYTFRKKLLEIHEPNLRKPSRICQKNEFFLEDNAKIRIDKNAGVVIETAAYDFKEYLKISMNISAEVVTAGNADISVTLAEKEGIDLGEFKAYKGFLIQVSECGIKIFAHDDRGAMQALYYIEDLMTFAGAPAVSYGDIKKKAMFSPQMVHSGYQQGIYPDEYLSRIAHEGRDAILMIVRDGEDYVSRVNEMIFRAAKYGIDVYAYSHFKSGVSPEADNAEEYYDSKYGRLFRDCCGLKGVVLVGESVQFPSKDPRVADSIVVDGIPTGEPTSGWFPCCDYPKLLKRVKMSARKYNPEADIVFWTYNWFWRPESVDLIKILPTDISLMATFEMFHPRIYGAEKARSRCDDYTLAFEGPGDYFVREAKIAKERGIRLYSMTNTGGRTWDFGTIPYEPMPQQWMRRYNAMQEAHDKWGLCGIMECHDYGFTPSFITKLSKHAFFEPYTDTTLILKTILSSEYGEENEASVEKGLDYFSEAIRYYTPTNADQYGAFRLGPSFPFNLFSQTRFPDYPGAFAVTNYTQLTGGYESPLSLRIYPEIESLETMLKYMEKGMQILYSVSSPNKKLNCLINLGQFITNCVKTGLNHKRWYTMCCRLKCLTNPDELASLFDDMESLLLEERKNAENTISLVECDSSLGWEASMEEYIRQKINVKENYYLTDRWHLEWKMRQIDYVIKTEIGGLRESLKLHLTD